MTKKRLLVLFMAVIFIFTMSVSAMARASDQISSYDIRVTASSGELKIYFSVFGAALMYVLG